MTSEAINIRQYFIYKQKEKNPYYNLLSKFDDEEVWEKLANKCKELNVSDTYYLDYVFNELKTTKYTIFPKTLLSSKISNSLRDFTINEGKDCLIDIKSYVINELEKAKSLIINFKKFNADKSSKLVLLIKGFSMPAWVRICLSSGDKEVINNYYNEAINELNSILGLKEELLNNKNLYTSWINQ